MTALHLTDSPLAAAPASHGAPHTLSLAKRLAAFGRLFELCRQISIHAEIGPVPAHLLAELGIKRD